MGPEFVMIFFAATGLVIVGMVLFSRNRKQQLMHEERMAAFEKGVAVPPVQEARPWSPRVYLLRGLIWSFVGAASIVCLLGVAASSRRPLSASDQAFEAKRLSDVAGISYQEAIRLVEKDGGLHHDGPTEAIALLGLIPLAVGMAYLVFYYTGSSGTPQVDPAPGPAGMLN